MYPGSLPSLLGACLLLGACTPRIPDAPPEPQWFDLAGESGITGFETRFHSQDRFSLSEPQKLAVRDACPVLKQARFRKDARTVYLLELRGDGLSEKIQVQAHLSDGAFARAGSRFRDGVLSVPIACESCSVFFTSPLEDGRLAACRGPGYSLTVTNGQLTSP